MEDLDALLSARSPSFPKSMASDAELLLASVMSMRDSAASEDAAERVKEAKRKLEAIRMVANKLASASRERARRVWTAGEGLRRAEVSREQKRRFDYKIAEEEKKVMQFSIMSGHQVFYDVYEGEGEEEEVEEEEVGRAEAFADHTLPAGFQVSPAFDDASLQAFQHVDELLGGEVQGLSGYEDGYMEMGAGGAGAGDEFVPDDFDVGESLSAIRHQYDDDDYDVQGDLAGEDIGDEDMQLSDFNEADLDKYLLDEEEEAGAAGYDYDPVKKYDVLDVQDFAVELEQEVSYEHTFAPAAAAVEVERAGAAAVEEGRSKFEVKRMNSAVSSSDLYGDFTEEENASIEKKFREEITRRLRGSSAVEEEEDVRYYTQEEVEYGTGGYKQLYGYAPAYQEGYAEEVEEEGRGGEESDLDNEIIESDKYEEHVLDKQQEPEVAAWEQRVEEEEEEHSERAKEELQQRMESRAVQQFRALARAREVRRRRRAAEDWNHRRRVAHVQLDKHENTVSELLYRIESVLSESKQLYEEELRQHAQDELLLDGLGCSQEGRTRTRSEGSARFVSPPLPSSFLPEYVPEEYYGHSYDYGWFAGMPEEGMGMEMEDGYGYYEPEEGYDMLPAGDPRYMYQYPVYAYDGYANYHG
eukprot:747808-Hanusia_phi.AAC.2